VANHALTDDPRVPLTRSWLGSKCEGCTNHVATEGARGSQATNWPLAEIVARGYALAAFYSGDIDSDRADVSDGIYAWLAGGNPARNNPTNRGTLAAWAWGFHRCVDYLITEPSVDMRRIAAVGHSRNGKTALLAAAFDERITMVFSTSGRLRWLCADRSKAGQSVQNINEHFRTGSTRSSSNSRRTRTAAVRSALSRGSVRAAARAVLQRRRRPGSNPAGQFEVLQAADPVYRFLGVEGLTAKVMPPQRQLVESRLGYYIREGKHSMTADDWAVFLNFADRQWRRE